MSERFFRIVLGVSLLLLLALDWPMGIYGYVALLLFEGLTNLRIPILVSRLRYGRDYVLSSAAPGNLRRFSFEAERGLRFVVAMFVLIPYTQYPDLLWFFPWFVGTALLMAGLTNICPMVMALRGIGLR